MAIVPSGSDPGSAVVTEDAPGGSGSFEVDTAGLEPGGYEAVLTSRGWGRARPRRALDPRPGRRHPGLDRSPELSGGGADRRELDRRPGEPLGLDRGLPRRRQSDPKVDSYLIWNYVGQHAAGAVPPSVEGSMTLDETVMGNPWPLPPGRYVVHYLVVDRYRSIGSATFEVDPARRDL